MLLNPVRLPDAAKLASRRSPILRASEQIAVRIFGRADEIVRAP
jgi:hypothetical protein